MRDEEDHYPSELHRVTRVRSLGGYRLEIKFSNGAAGEWDFSDLLAEGGFMIQPLRSVELFIQVSERFGALEWPNGYDICADKLYLDMHRGGAFAPDAPPP